MDELDQCLEFCETDFSHVANSGLFEGNILRFKALAILTILEKKLRAQEGSSSTLIRAKEAKFTRDEQQEMLKRAIGALENALEISRAGAQDPKGKALAYYQLGYLH